jgi:UDP-N-acetylglucosamine--N-acetylmuramyl-(pentapeptide) pyrophosphoryl-undecaprenol N-acetylglucosamine transferase
MTTRIIIAGGGTGGHVFPAIATARALVKLDPDVEPVFVGVSGKIEERLVPAAGFRFHDVPALPLPRRPSPALLRVPFGLRAATRRSRTILLEEEAAAVVTFGGYVSFPVSRAAVLEELPLVIHEQNAVPGLANRWAARRATRIAVTFPGSADRFPRPGRVSVTGNPVRDEILSIDRSRRRAAARESFGLRRDARTLLVFGGSQGARSINRAIVESYALWSDPQDLQILHAAGNALYREAAAAWERARSSGSGPLVRCVDFVENMGAAYAAADVVVCRAGATSIAELTALGLPSVLAPYPHATRDHQTHNAAAVEAVGGARAIDDADLTGRALVDAIEPWLRDDRARADASQASRVFGRRDAAEQVARIVLAELQAARDDQAST